MRRVYTKLPLWQLMNLSPEHCSIGYLRLIEVHTNTPCSCYCALTYTVPSSPLLINTKGVERRCMSLIDTNDAYPNQSH